MYSPNLTAEAVLCPNLKAAGLVGHVRNIAAGAGRRVADQACEGARSPPPVGPCRYDSALYVQRRAFPGRPTGFARTANLQELETDRVRRRLDRSHQGHSA